MTKLHLQNLFHLREISDSFFSLHFSSSVYWGASMCVCWLVGFWGCVGVFGYHLFSDDIIFKNNFKFENKHTKNIPRTQRNIVYFKLKTKARIRYFEWCSMFVAFVFTLFHVFHLSEFSTIYHGTPIRIVYCVYLTVYICNMYLFCRCQTLILLLTFTKI